MDAAYTFTTAGKLASADVLSTPAPGGELVARKVTYEYASRRPIPRRCRRSATTRAARCAATRTTRSAAW
ncbi:MAG: hypothetical protein HS111_20880 [Kofleriaceae bacterium]|nr:hypothetical protein [Kofleriaceae bacterium]